MEQNYLEHYGIPRMHWGERRWQNPDGSLTPAGRVHYGVGEPRNSEDNKKYYSVQYGSASKKEARAEKKAQKAAAAKQRALDAEKMKQEQEAAAKQKILNNEKKRKEQEEKNKILNSKDVDTILSNADKFTAKELQTALNSARREENKNAEKTKQQYEADRKELLESGDMDAIRANAKKYNFTSNEIEDAQKASDKAAKERKKILDTGDADEILANADKFTANELRDAQNKIQARLELNTLAKKQEKEKVRERVEQAQKLLTTVGAIQSGAIKIGQHLGLIDEDEANKNPRERFNAIANLATSIGSFTYMDSDELAEQAKKYDAMRQIAENQDKIMGINDSQSKGKYGTTYYKPSSVSVTSADKNNSTLGPGQYGEPTPYKPPEEPKKEEPKKEEPEPEEKRKKKRLFGK